jgi:hypothetical protein
MLKNSRSKQEEKRKRGKHDAGKTGKMGFV